MFEKKEKEKNNTPKDNSSKKIFQVPPIGIIDNIILTKKEVWAYYILAEKPYSFLSIPARLSLAQSTITALGSLCQSASKKVDCHILISNQPFDSRAWEKDIIDKYYKYNQQYNPDRDNRNFMEFIMEQSDSLYMNNYQKRVTYLGVKIADRGTIDAIANPLEFGFKDAIASIKQSVSKMFLFDETEITADEERKLRSLEESVYNIMAGSSLQGKRPTAEDCLLLIKRRLYPAMPTPYLETDHDNRIGLNDIIIETGGEIEEKARYVKIKQICNGEELTGYRATLSFSKFPKDLIYPNTIPPLHKPEMLGFTVNSRFSLIPTEEMKKRLYKKQKDTDDEINNLADSNQRPTASLKETVKDQQILEQDLNEDNLPWIIGHYRITVEAPTEEDIRAIVANLKIEYKKYEFVLSWTTGDQLSMLKEEFLGGKLEIKDFAQTTNLALLGLAGINFGGQVGDPVKQEIRYSE